MTRQRESHGVSEIRIPAILPGPLLVATAHLAQPKKVKEMVYHDACKRVGAKPLCPGSEGRAPPISAMAT